MALWVSEYEWDAGNELHFLEKHAIYPHEVEEIVDEVAYRSHVRRKADVYTVLGRTEAGDYLVVVLLHHGLGRYRPVTGYPMNDATRRRYQQAIGER